jgi:hypothetical protein
LNLNSFCSTRRADGVGICNADKARKLHGRDEFGTVMTDLGRPRKTIKAWHARQNLASALMAPVCTSTIPQVPLEPKPKLGHIDCGE